MSVSRARLHRFNRAKRVIDVMLVLAASPLLLIVGSVTAIAVGLNMGRPILFSQPRVGMGEREFGVFKFRTMSSERDAQGDLLPDADRLTRLGRFIRKTSLDEIPQFINVLRGDMSLIGPRPLLVDYLPYYTKEEGERHRVRPGITGLAQTSGRNNILWDERLKLDISYVESARLSDDLKILVRTIRQVFSAHNVSPLAGDSGERLDVVRRYPRARGYALRRFEYVDIPTRVAWFTNTESRRHMSLPSVVTLEGTTEWLQRARRDSDRKDFVVYRTSDGEIAALLGVRERTERGIPEMYMIVAPDRHGQGLGGTALELLLSWLQGEPRYHGCWLTVAEANVRAVALYRRFGFQVIRRVENDHRLEMTLTWDISK